MRQRYSAPPARIIAQRMAAAKLALADLTPEARAEVDAMLFNLRRVQNIGSETALEVLAAVAILTGREHGNG